MAALLDLGVDIKKVRSELKKLPVGGYTIKTTRERRHSIEGASFKVGVKESRHHRTFKDIKGLIEKSKLSKDVKSLSTSIFRKLAEAEGRVHAVAPGKVQFHEVGAIDSIVDIVGTAIAVTELKADRVYASPLPLGSGLVETSHGTMPVPAPATLELLKGVPVLPSPVARELTTPTGAAILKTLCAGFGEMPAMTVEGIGYGAGSGKFKEIPNLVRVVLGEGTHAASGLTVIETNIDDMSPQLAGHLMEKLFAAGALDVYFTAVQMKKSRPGVLLTVLTDEGRKKTLTDIIFEESTTIGVRAWPVERRCLERKMIKVKTKYGTVGVKLSLKDGQVVNLHPEYEDCRRAADRKKVPLKAVMDAAREAVGKKQ